VLPRIGSQVMVCFANGDIDQPVIVGASYGETDSASARPIQASS
jgi:uncharacterized protein involved in type VI secretion and phage assembly